MPSPPRDDLYVGNSAQPECQREECYDTANLFAVGQVGVHLSLLLKSSC